MKKAHKIIYWIATAWLALGMLSTGIVQLLQLKEETEFIIQLGYPYYFLTILGVWKILGVIAILLPGFALVKEWTYAGFFFVTTGALFSHIAAGNIAIGDWFPALLLLALTIVSWYYRPVNRRLMANNKTPFS